MKYADENMIKMMNEHKKKVHGSLEEGYIIKEVEYTFVEENFFDNKMKIMLPKCFDDMPIELAKIKYPMEQRPKIIKTNEKTDINISLNLTHQPYVDNQAKVVLKALKNAIANVHQNNLFLEQNIETNEYGATIAWFEFISHGIDGRLYNLMFFTSVDGKMMNGVCNCAEKDLLNWRVVFMEILKTINIA